MEKIRKLENSPIKKEKFRFSQQQKIFPQVSS